MLIALSTWPCLVRAATLAGSVAYGGPCTGQVWVVANPHENRWPVEYATRIPGPGAYSISSSTEHGPLRVPEDYWLYAFMDANGNEAQDFWEPTGAFTGNPVRVTGDASALDLTLTDPSPAGADTDGDGMSDAWESDHGFDPHDPWLGSGRDGVLYVPAGAEVVVNDVQTTVEGSQLPGSTALTVAATGGFGSNDLVLIICSQDPESEPAENRAGAYELQRVAGATTTSLLLTRGLEMPWDATTGRVIQVIRIPEYTSVRVGGTLTCLPWNGSTGGILAFLCSGEVGIGAGGVVTVSGKGYRGGSARPAGMRTGQAGETTSGVTRRRIRYFSELPLGGGGAGYGAFSSGGGGAFGSSGGQGGDGVCNRWQGQGARVYGNAVLSKLYFGSGGGGSGGGDNGRYGAGGGAGGGILVGRAVQFRGAGAIMASGQPGEDGVKVFDEHSGAGGGGGAGGSVLLTADVVETTVEAEGGLGGAKASDTLGRDGGAGGEGRVRLDLAAPSSFPGSAPVPGHVGTFTSDSDGDGLNDREEFLAGANPFLADTDGDLLPDEWEGDYGTDPATPSTDDDNDGDNLDNATEFALGTRPDLEDTDWDGMPDDWEVRYTLAPTDPHEGQGTLGDPDLDGCFNIDEYIADTDPTNSLSCFAITGLRLQSNGVRIGWMSVTSSSDRLYTLYRRTDLMEGAWEPVPGQIDVQGTGSLLTLWDSDAPADHGFYRVGVRLP